MQTVIASTPHRVSLAGGATDLEDFYKHYGYGATVGIAIEPFSHVIVMPRSWDDSKVMLRYSKTVEASSVDQLGGDPAQNAVKAACKLVRIENGFELTSQSGTSYRKGGSGLGSSSSFSVSLLHSLQVFNGSMLPTAELSHDDRTKAKLRLAEQAYYLERVLLGQKCGKQDQYTSALGGINYFRYNGDGSVEITPINLSLENRLRLEGQLHLFYTGIHRDANSLLSVQAARAQDNSQSLLKMRSMADDALARLLRGDVDFIGDLLASGWEMKKTLDPNISNEKIDRAYKGAIDKGASGGRLVGAGAGGYLLFSIPAAKHHDVRRFLREEGMQERPVVIDYEGSRAVKV
jgi:D-glycero-alpha-D-manno-heptose-7-phosphate kinase